MAPIFFGSGHIVVVPAGEDDEVSGRRNGGLSLLGPWRLMLYDFSQKP